MRLSFSVLLALVPVATASSACVLDEEAVGHNAPEGESPGENRFKVEIGAGTEPFVPIEPGGDLQGIRGPQGGLHLGTNLRIHLDHASLSDLRAHDIRPSVYDENGARLGQQLITDFVHEDPDAVVRSDLRYFFVGAGQDALPSGSLLTLVAEIRDPTGALLVSDALEVRYRAPN